MFHGTVGRRTLTCVDMTDNIWQPLAHSILVKSPTSLWLKFIEGEGKEAKLV